MAWVAHRTILFDMAAHQSPRACTAVARQLPARPRGRSRRALPAKTRGRSLLAEHCSDRFQIFRGASPRRFPPTCQIWCVWLERRWRKSRNQISAGGARACTNVQIVAYRPPRVSPLGDRVETSWVASPCTFLPTCRVWCMWLQ